jgi:hypothetical protein
MSPNHQQQQPAALACLNSSATNDLTTTRERWFPKLEDVNRPTVETAAAAYYLNRKQQTLRCWSFLDTGPIRPLRVHGRLAWPVSEIKRLLEVAA